MNIPMPASAIQPPLRRMNSIDPRGPNSSQPVRKSVRLTVMAPAVKVSGLGEGPDLRLPSTKKTLPRAANSAKEREMRNRFIGEI